MRRKQSWFQKLVSTILKKVGLKLIKASFLLALVSYLVPVISGRIIEETSLLVPTVSYALGTLAFCLCLKLTSLSSRRFKTAKMRKQNSAQEEKLSL